MSDLDKTILQFIKKCGRRIKINFIINKLLMGLQASLILIIIFGEQQVDNLLKVTVPTRRFFIPDAMFDTLTGAHVQFVIRDVRRGLIPCITA